MACNCHRPDHDCRACRDPQAPMPPEPTPPRDLDCRFLISEGKPPKPRLIPIVARALPGAPNVRPTDDEITADEREARRAGLCVLVVGAALVLFALWYGGPF